MTQKRGLGIGKDSIFKNTLKEKKAKETISYSPKVEKKEIKKSDDPVLVEEWKKSTLHFKTSHKKTIDDIAYYSRKEKRDVLAEIIQYYLDNAKYEIPQKI